MDLAGPSDDCSTVAARPSRCCTLLWRQLGVQYGRRRPQQRCNQREQAARTAVPRRAGRRNPLRVLAHAPGGRRGPVPRALVSGWCAVLAVVPLRSPSPGAVCRTPACHECEPLAVRTPACGFEWRAIPLAGWLSGFEPSHIGCRGVPRGGWVGGKPSLPGAACSALGGSGGAPRVVLLGRGSSFPLPPRKARDTHIRENPLGPGRHCASFGTCVEPVCCAIAFVEAVEPRVVLCSGGSRGVPVLVPVRASPVPSVVRNFLVKFFVV